MQKSINHTKYMNFIFFKQIIHKHTYTYMYTLYGKKNIISEQFLYNEEHNSKRL